MAYLDHAASTPLRPEALEAMMPFLTSSFANPSAAHRQGREARRALDDARDRVAAFAGCAAGEVVFTSGGTEADNLAVVGAATRGGVVVSATEHDAVLGPARSVGATVVGVDPDGQIDLDRLAAALTDTTVVVSVIAVQSETGVVSPLDAVADLVGRLAPAALIHTDAVQAAPFFSLRAIAARCDLVSISAHKIGGPKGVGALVVRGRARERLAPLLLGGGQERDLRAGTENVAGLVGFGAAASFGPSDAMRVAALRDELWSGISERVPSSRLTAEAAPRAPGICHVRFPGVVAEELLILLDESGVAASAGSACASGALEPSHVLAAMGWSETESREAVRFSLGRTTTADEVEEAIEAVDRAVGRLGGG